MYLSSITTRLKKVKQREKREKGNLGQIFYERLWRTEFNLVAREVALFDHQSRENHKNLKNIHKQRPQSIFFNQPCNSCKLDKFHILLLYAYFY